MKTSDITDRNPQLDDGKRVFNVGWLVQTAALMLCMAGQVICKDELNGRSTGRMASKVCPVEDGHEEVVESCTVLSEGRNDGEEEEEEEEEERRGGEGMSSCESSSQGKVAILWRQGSDPDKRFSEFTSMTSNFSSVNNFNKVEDSKSKSSLASIEQRRLKRRKLSSLFGENMVKVEPTIKEQFLKYVHLIFVACSISVVFWPCAALMNRMMQAVPRFYATRCIDTCPVVGNGFDLLLGWFSIFLWSELVSLALVVQVKPRAVLWIKFVLLGVLVYLIFFLIIHFGFEGSFGLHAVWVTAIAFLLPDWTSYLVHYYPKLCLERSLFLKGFYRVTMRSITMMLFFICIQATVAITASVNDVLFEIVISGLVAPGLRLVLRRLGYFVARSFGGTNFCFIGDIYLHMELILSTPSFVAIMLLLSHVSFISALLMNLVFELVEVYIFLKYYPKFRELMSSSMLHSIIGESSISEKDLTYFLSVKLANQSVGELTSIVTAVISVLVLNEYNLPALSWRVPTCILLEILTDVLKERIGSKFGIFSARITFHVDFWPIIGLLSQMLVCFMSIHIATNIATTL